MYPNYRQTCPPGTFSYSVQSGDNFYQLARRFKTTVSALKSANPSVDPERLRIGQSICIPRQQAYPACPEGNYYTIVHGDTINRIAKRYNVSLDDLLEANPSIDPDKLFIGQIICIPLATPPVACPQGSVTYTIRPGDTFFNIAERFNTTVASIRRLNPTLNPEALLIGQKICTPKTTESLPQTKRIPVVVEGEIEYREARLQKSVQGYNIYVLNNFKFTGEEPGIDQIYSTFDDRFFVRIEKLTANANVTKLKENAVTALREVGTPRELRNEQIFDPFFRSAEFFLHASNPRFSKNIILLNIGGSLFRFTMNMPNAEAAEGIIPSFYAMLRTITTP